jgi:hypothetical protein
MAPAAIVKLITAFGTFLTVLFGVGTWILNLREKRRVDAYVRKEQVYKEIVVALQALYKSDNTEQKARFIETTRVTWICCPDDVVRAVNAILDALIDKDQSSRQKALGNAVAAMRKNLMPETTLTGDDFRHVTA